MAEEQWRVWSARDEAYEVSNLGRMRNRKTGHIRKPGTLAKGYQKQVFVNPRQTVLVHRVVWEAFNGKTELQINHIDGNKANNQLSNLEAVTPKQNMQHASRAGLLATGIRHHSSKAPDRVPKGATHPCSKVSEAQVLEMRRRYAAGERPSDIARALNASFHTVYDVLRRRTWRHLK